MDECRPIPCPGFQEVNLRVEAVCDCPWDLHPGSLECPVHGDQVREFLEGFRSSFEPAASLATIQAEVAHVRAMYRMNPEPQLYDLGQGFADDPR